MGRLRAFRRASTAAPWAPWTRSRSAGRSDGREYRGIGNGFHTREGEDPLTPTKYEPVVHEHDLRREER